MNKICVTPKASLGFHQAYYDKAFTFGMKVTSLEGTSDLMSYYPDTVKDWIRRNGGLTTEMKKVHAGARPPQKLVFSSGVARWLVFPVVYLGWSPSTCPLSALPVGRR